MSQAMAEHQVNAFVEDVHFLREAGERDEEIARRLELSRGAFEKRMARAGIPVRWNGRRDGE